MFRGLKNHPFAIQAHFDYSLVLTYAIPTDALKGLIPEFLQFDIWKEKYAFFTVAMVKVKELRPKGLPRFMGQDFHLIGHRFFVQYINTNGKRLRGLYIVKSQTDKRQMTVVGNLLTHYKYEKIKIRSERIGEELTIYKNEHERVVIRKGDDTTPLPQGSVFTSWKEARRFAGPLPFTFSDLGNGQVLIIEGVRSNWVPQPVEIDALHWDLQEYPFMKQAVLSNAFIVEDIPYHWQQGKIEKWKV